MAGTHLTRTATTGNRTKATLSVWIKKSTNAEQFIFYNHESNTTNFRIRFNPEVLQVETLSGSSVVGTLTTNRKFRDPSGWMNIVVAIDSTNATADDRMKIYVNGVQETSFSARTNPSQNQNMAFNESGHIQYIGSQAGSNYFNGSMSHLHWIDGTAYPASTFGSTDSTTGEWKINTSPSVTYGTNGFFILKDGNSVTDQSGQTNNLVVSNGTLTKTEDCPSNVFATWNPLVAQGDTFANGNTYVARNSSGWRGGFSTIALPPTGKFYCEFKRGSGDNLRIGIADFKEGGCIDLQNRGQANEIGENANSLGYLASNGSYYIKSASATYGSYGSAMGSSDVLGMAVDMTNMKLYFSINGVFQNSGVPTSGSTGTGALSIPATISEYFIGASFTGTGCYINSGNGYFGTTAVTTNSGNGYAGAEGASKFTYDPPNLYSALNTKGLNL